jgi:hypothetical protein
MTHAAARAGDLEALKRAHELYGWESEVCEVAAAHGHLDCLKYAHEHGCPCPNMDPCIALQEGHLACVYYILDHDLPWNPLMLANCAVRNDQGDVLRSILQRRQMAEYSYLIVPAGGRGSLACLRVLVEHFQDLHMFAYAMYKATSRGHIACVRYLHSVGCVWARASTVCSKAAKHGHTACLRFAHEHGCPVDKKVAVAAASHGRLACLKYLVSAGCPMDVDTTDAAAGRVSATRSRVVCPHFLHHLHGCPVSPKQIKCLHYLHKLGCPVSAVGRRLLVTKVWLPMWRDHVRAHPILFYWRESAGKRSYGPGGAGRERDREAFEADFGDASR